MTFKEFAWIGMGILVSWNIIMDSIEIIQGWVKSQINTIENADEER